MAAARGKMSEEHKKALAEGRRLSQSVREYLEALEEHKPKRGRKRTPESVRKRLNGVKEKLKDASGIDKVQLAQDRIDLEKELDRLENKPDLAKVESGFVKAARDYSERKGISYAAWREAGVPADVLKKAGITRGFDPSS